MASKFLPPTMMAALVSMAGSSKPSISISSISNVSEQPLTSVSPDMGRMRAKGADSFLLGLLFSTFFVERVLAGLRETITNDDQLLVAASAIFDGLLAGFVKEEQPNEQGFRTSG